MTRQEVLEKAIQKAIDGGWAADSEGYTPDNLAKYMLSDSLNNSGYALETIIFNHDFAKALWGDSKPTATRTDNTILLDYHYGWDHHLQQMVIAEDPIKYLEDNL